MAYHLHRLKLVGRPLYRSGWHRVDAADLAAGRRPLTHSDVATLAARLGINLNELVRELSDAEQREWAFYRAVASRPAEVWQIARATWSGRGLSDKQAAALMGYSAKSLSNALSIDRPLHFEAAARLTTALNIPGGPDALLPPPKDNDPQRSR